MKASLQYPRYFGPIPLQDVQGRIIYNGYSKQDHGPVVNSPRASATDGAVLENELDLDWMFHEDDSRKV